MSHAVERRGGGGGRNPSPSPPPWLLPRKRNTWGVSSPQLPGAEAAAAAPARPAAEKGPTGSRAASGWICL
ncbi:hypothetical protein AV530_013047 [Patagioenas fasciata monilis]|uniref:Uncharacterized protein n=1 Tax=Patagioenas fasciata monilis TaxID=372326 RepID=A0A1V4JA94_PATFA|nr:hypothetical protein AV530_013047 [Patagioenas fasciata monilis]